MKISNLAHIDTGANIGRNVEIGPFTTIYEDVVIGDDTWIGPNVTIMNGARIGKSCKIFPGAVISAIPQDLKFEGEYTTLKIGDHVVIRECCTLNRGTKASGTTVLGDHVYLMAYSHIAHDCHVDDHAILANGATLAGHVYIGKHALLGGLVGVQQFISIGDHVMIAGASKVRKDVPPYIRAAREPLCYIGVNVIGLRRRNYRRNKITEIKAIYDTIYFTTGSLSARLDLVKEQFRPSIERDNILSFCKATEKGIIKRGFQVISEK